MISVIQYKKKTNIIRIILNFIIFFYNFKNALLSECDYTHPFKKNGGECIERGCSFSDIKSGTCKIENDIIKTQWFNNIIDYSVSGINYATVSTTPNGNLICSSSFYNTSKTKKYYFGIKRNGRPFFLQNGKDTIYSETDSDKPRNEGVIYAINLNGIKDKEYVIGFGVNNYYFEMYDFADNNNVIIYKKAQNKFFGVEYNSFKRASIFKLNNCEDDYYIISFISQASGGQKTFYIKKFLFTSLDINSYSPMVKTESIISAYISISSCFQTENNYIFCFFLDNANNYLTIVYDQNLVLKTNLAIAQAGSFTSHDFYKCVHFIGEAGAFLYFNSNNNIEIQFKQYIPERIINYFTYIESISITNNNYINNLKLNDMTRLDDKKFCIILLNNDYTEIDLFIVNNYIDEKIKIRHFNIKNNNLYNFKIPEELKLDLYNDLIAMAFSLRNSTGTFGSIVIFSYPNSTDFNIDITNNLTSYNNLIINFYEYCNIENNLFGYIFKGIKIIDISQGYKLTSFINKTDIKINENDIINDNDFGELGFNEDINIGEEGRIIFAMVLTEPEYDIFNQYSIEIDKQYCGGICNDEEEYFKKKLYVGRNSFCDISINPDTITNNCEHIDEKCVLCIKNSNICVACKFSSRLSENDGKICLNEIIPTTTNIMVDTTIITTEPHIETTNIKVDTTIITTEPHIETTNIRVDTTIITTEPNIETTNIKVDTTIITTEPNIETTNFNVDTTIITTEPHIETTNIRADTTIITTEPNIETTNFNVDTTIITTEPNIETTNINDKPTNNKNNTDINDNTNIISGNTNQGLNEKSNCTKEMIKNNQCSSKATIAQIEEIKNDLLSNNYTKDNIIIRTENIILQLSTLEDQKNSDNDDISNIDLGECEERLKKSKNIPDDESLIIYKTDLKIGDFSTTYVAYEIYDPISLEKLDLSICNDVDISISVPVKINNNIEVLYKSLSDSGYNLFDKNDSFYNDICAKYTSINGTDILLSDRKADIYTSFQKENESLCQAGCEIESYNSENKKVKCNCTVNTKLITEINELDIENLFDIEKIEETFFKTLSNSNFRVMKCYKLVLDLSGMKNNIGQIIMTILFVIFFVLIIVFFIKGNKQTHHFINFILQLKNINPFYLKKQSLKIKNNSKINKKKILTKKSEKQIRKSSFEILQKKHISKHKSTKSIKKNPPKRNKSKSLKNLLIHTDKNKILNQDSNNKPINNNILLNVQVFNQKKKKKKRNSLFNPNNRIFKKGINKILSLNPKKHQSKKSISSISSYTKKYLNNDSYNLFNKRKEKETKINNKSKDYRLLNDYEINNLEYEEAVKIDQRKYIQYYWSLLRQKQIILFTFFLSNDYNIITIKIALLIISFSLYFTINGFFFSDSTMHKAYVDNGKYDFIYKIPQLLYSSMVTFVINIILKKLSLSQKNILEIKEERDFNKAIQKSKEIESSLKIRFFLFFILSFILIIFFWYFISCFCAVFVNTQIILIEDTLISFGFSLLSPFGINLLPGIFRISALRRPNKSKECIYKIGQILSYI